ncbi:MAG TPA: hypothetical protein VF103_10460 [Polyangiaceae bacterium]
MNMRKRCWGRLAVLSVALSFVSVGCKGNDDDDNDDGSSCSRICEDAKDCPGSDQSIDCREACDQNEALVDRAGCNAEYDDLTDCLGDASDICEASSNECASENEAALRCITRYCETHIDECDVEG